jgi:hypothetical protein
MGVHGAPCPSGDLDKDGADHGDFVSRCDAERSPQASCELPQSAATSDCRGAVHRRFVCK